MAVLKLPSWGVCAVYLAAFAAVMSLPLEAGIVDPTWRAAGKLVSIGLVGFYLLWVTSLHGLATIARSRSNPTGLHFALSVVALLCAGLAIAFDDRGLPKALIEISLTIGLTLLLIGTWGAAQKLVEFEDRYTTTTWHRFVGTFLLIFYLPIGIWLLRPRVSDMLDSMNEF